MKGHLWLGASAMALGIFGFLSSAQADLIVVPNGGITAAAVAQPAFDGGPGIPVGLVGMTEGAELEANTTGEYTFTFEGAGNSYDTNEFTLSLPGGGQFIWTGVPHPQGSTALGTSFTVQLTAGELIPFTFTNESVTPCSLGDGGTSTRNVCRVLVALDGSASLTGPSSIAYLGFNDGGSDGIVYQNLVVEVQDPPDPPDPVPEPATLALMGGGLLGAVAFARRRWVRRS